MLNEHKDQVLDDEKRIWKRIVRQGHCGQFGQLFDRVLFIEDQLLPNAKA